MANKKKKRVGPPKPRNTSGLVPWKPGQSGDPKGRPKSITLSEAYRHKLEETFPGSDHTWAQEIAERMAKLALRRVAAASELADRTEGKAPQFMQLNNGAERIQPVSFEVVFTNDPELPKPAHQLEQLQLNDLDVKQSQNTGGDCEHDT